jgi:hypothetical protein
MPLNASTARAAVRAAHRRAAPIAADRADLVTASATPLNALTA